MNTILKQYNLLILIAILGVTFFTSCVDEEFSNKNKIKEGIPVGLTLSFTQSDIANIETKADIGDEENKVYDIRVFIFDSKDKLEYTELIANKSNKALDPATINIPEGSLTSGVKYIYAIANTKSSLGAFNKELDKVESLSDLTTLTYTMKPATEQRLSGRLLMGGFYTEKGQADNGYCLVDAKNAKNGIVPLSGTICLVRVDSKIKFNVTANSGITFVPKKWKVVNMPKTTNVFEKDTDAESEYSISSENVFDDNIIDDTYYKGGSFTFYLFENRKGIKGGKDDRSIDYKDRELENKTDNGHNQTGGQDPRSYVYADDNATYVVLSGSYRGIENNKEVSAEVEYRIHLGYVDWIAKDFSSKRNKNYTYNVTVKGVDNIIVEVEEEEERQPGAEGDVIIADQNILVDAHYEAQVITFSRDALADLSVQVNTPFDNGIYSIKDGQVEDKLEADYKWVKFVRNKKDGDYYSTKLALYPGDQKHAETNINEYGLITVNEGVDETGNYLTIKELLCQLQNNKDPETTNDFWDSEGKVCYTAFVDEYYYDEDPKTGISSTTLWKKFANAPNRKMHILCDTKYSPDKQSSLTRSTILINQRSIKTVYNLDKNLSSLTTAWGIETVDETPDKYYSDGKLSSETRTNGRYLTFKIAGNDMLGNYWSNYIDFTSTENDKLQYDYNKAEYACMQRNRDLNGDGMVSADEIRWYLPATNQYTALWIGKDALDPEARLFQVDPSQVTKRDETSQYSRSKFHYVSSNGMRFWSEQGASVGNTIFGLHQYPYKFRCARNLGISNDKPASKESGEYVDYVQTTRNTSDEINGFNLEYLNPSARRSSLETNQLASSGEHKGADLNRPYKKFEVNSENTSTQGCPTGYRVPNQREIALIAGYFADLGSALIESNTHTDLSNTSYSDKSTSVYSIRPSTNGGLNEITLVSKSGITRCVRDTD